MRKVGCISCVGLSRHHFSLKYSSLVPCPLTASCYLLVMVGMITSAVSCVSGKSLSNSNSSFIICLLEAWNIRYNPVVHVFETHQCSPRERGVPSHKPDVAVLFGCLVII